ncbi:MAG: hypothetical protein WCF04_00200 [Candidatus Nanopelagicales bacterium]
MIDETILVELTEALTRAREAERQAAAELREAVRVAHAEGMTRYRIGQITNLARVTVQSWTA